MPLLKTPAAKPEAKALPKPALEALQKLCKTKTQAHVAQRLGVSPAAVNQALQGKYIGNVERMAERIRGELLAETVGCPTLGQVTLRICQDTREQPFLASNPLRVAQFKACRACPHNPKRETPDD
jgi:hypothetical protein